MCVEIEASAVEIDGDFEVLHIAKTARGLFNGLDLGVDSVAAFRLFSLRLRPPALWGIGGFGRKSRGQEKQVCLVYLVERHGKLLERSFFYGGACRGQISIIHFPLM